MRLKLAHNRKKLHKSSTVILSVFLFVLSLLEIVQPYVTVLEPYVSVAAFPFLSAGIAIAIGVGRYVQQNCLHDDVEESEDNSEESSV